MTRLSVRWTFVAGGAALLASFAACSQTAGDDPVAKSSDSVTTVLTKKNLPERFERTIGWGTAATQLAFKPAQTESVAYGPNAVAVLPNGETLVLDRLAGRVVAIDADSDPRTVATVPVDAEDLTTGNDGSIVAFSPLRARAWFFDADGKSAGELPVPRELREVTGLSVGASRRLTVRTGYQETLTIGSPSAPLPLAVTLAGKREGAYQLADGRGVAVRVDADGAQLLVVSQPADEAARSEVTLSHALPGDISAARIVGGQGSTVCLRAERVTSSPALAVERRALCVDALGGNVLLDEELPAPGAYVPRTELSFAGGRLSFIHPTELGLTVRSIRVAAGEEVQP